MPADHDALKLSLLGPVRATRGGADLPLGPARRAAVLAMLALHAGHAVARHELIGAVWGEEPPASAVGNVYTYVSALRQALEPDRDRWAAGQLLTSDGGSYCLHVGEQDVDAFRFEALREQSRALRATGDRAGELAALEAALRCWHGDEALAGVPGPYAEAQRVRLTELRLATAERHAGLLIELGRPDDAVTALRALIGTYPARETLTGLLATAQRAGRRSGDRAPARIRVANGTGPATLVGRDAEIAQLRDAVAAVAAGRGRSIRVEGIAGLGKSALLGAALLDDRPAGCRFGWGIGDELAQRTTLGVLIECAESATTGDDDRSLVEELAAGPRTADHAVALIRRAAAAAPLILVADDLPYADPVTLRVWAALHPVTREVPLLLVASARPGAPELRDVPVDDRIVLGPLTRHDATAVVRAVTHGPVDPPVLGRLLADAGGNPYYLRHLAATVRDGAARWTTPPGPLVAAVEAHLATLDEDTRHLLRAAAFLCDTGPAGCTVGEVAAVTGRGHAELRNLLRPAQESGVLTADPETVLFRHRVVARVLHESTPAALRVMLHRSFAEELAGHLAEADSAPERVVAQLLAGPVPLDAWAGRWLVRHVEELAAYAPGPTADVLARARTEPALDEDTRVVLSARLARLRHDRWENAIAEAGWVAARTADPELEAEMRWIMACGHDRQGDDIAAAGVARSVLMAGRVPAPWQRRFRSLLARVDRETSGEIPVIR